MLCVFDSRMVAESFPWYLHPALISRAEGQLFPVAPPLTLPAGLFRGRQGATPAPAGAQPAMVSGITEGGERTPVLSLSLSQRGHHVTRIHRRRPRN